MDEHFPRQQRLPLVWVVPGLALACVPALASSFMICGISGCSGGGFGRSTVAGLVVGSDFRGCPRHVDTATCLEEAGP